MYTNYNVFSINELPKTLIQKLVNFFSVEHKDFKYYREPSKEMVDNAKKMNDNSITRLNENNFWYRKLSCLRRKSLRAYLLSPNDDDHHKYTENVTKIEINKYQISYFNSTF